MKKQKPTKPSKLSLDRTTLTTLERARGGWTRNPDQTYDTTMCTYSCSCDNSCI